jgi:hypothetical protein
VPTSPHLDPDRGRAQARDERQPRSGALRVLKYFISAPLIRCGTRERRSCGCWSRRRTRWAARPAT